MSKAVCAAKASKSSMEWLEEGMRDPATRDRVLGLLAEMNLVQDLVRLREEAGLTQVQLAERLGVRQPAIAQLEGGRASDIKASTLVKHAAALGARVRIVFEKERAAAKPAAKPRARKKPKAA
jgi:DNA-binding XRE family transcriptional regulator